MTTILETTTLEGQTASNGRFFEPIDPLVLERARTLPNAKSVSAAAAQQLEAVIEADLDGWRRDPAKFPGIDGLILKQNTYEDHASLVNSAGRAVVRRILDSPPRMETIGHHSYWTTWMGERAVLSTTDDTGEPYINFTEDKIDVDPDNGVRIATPIDYARLLVDIAIEQSRLPEVA